MGPDIVQRLLKAHTPPRCMPGICVTCDAAEDIMRLEQKVDELRQRNRDLLDRIHALNRELRSVTTAGDQR